MFTQDEVAYIRSQKLARIGTASEDGRPDVAAVGFDFDGEYFYVSGYANQRTLKYRNTKANPFASLVIDDLASVRPWRPRGIKIHATVDFVHRNGYAGEKEYLRLKPQRKRSWGLE
ncbi:MAG: PPOX class F420-dependent oxidoreductase [Anaerolineales bacterium]|nr:PPOX class F420-dependent oxidoreductase [Anaerolineales bacterium]